jgi:predicted amidohydrolase
MKIKFINNQIRTSVKVPILLNLIDDKPVFIYAIATLLLRQQTDKNIKINLDTIVNTIKEQVSIKGSSVIDFPEYWGLDYPYFEDILEKAEKIYNKLSNDYLMNT